MALDYLGNRFCGATTSPITGGVWWVGWHDMERVEGVAAEEEDAVRALDHFLDGRRSAGRVVARQATRGEEL